MELAERIKTWREWAGLSKANIADVLEVSTQTVRNWESGRFAPTYDNLELFANAVGISLPQFWGELPPVARVAS